MNPIKLFFLPLFAMVLTACSGEGSGLPSQGGGETVPAIVSLQVTPATKAVPVGFAQQYIALATLADGSIMDVTKDPVVRWSTSNPAIAKIDRSGLATGLAPGKVTITASGMAHNVPFERKVLLTVTNAVVTALQVTPSTATVPVGLEQAFTATAILSDGSTLDVTRQAVLTWSSDSLAIATIENVKAKKGHATGITPGTTTITASGTANGISFSASAQLNVSNAVVTALQVTPANASVPVGLDQPFTATATLSDGSTLDVTNDTALSWTSSNSGIATIISNQAGANGIATGMATGSVIITASGSANGTSFSATAQLDVTNAVVTALQVTPATASVPVGLEQLFTAIAILSDGSTRDVTNNTALSWASSDAGIATIISNQAGTNGIATGVTPGTVTITAAGIASGTPFSASAQLNVTNAVVTTLQVTPTNASVPVGLERQFTATATLSDGRAIDVTNDTALSWTSSDAGIATIVSNQAGANGIATGMATGSVIITASGSANGTPFSATAQLDVTNAIVTALQVTPATSSVPAGLTQQFSAIATFSDGHTLDVTRQTTVTWSSDNSAIATIGNIKPRKGLATGVTSGTVTITATGTANGTPFSDAALFDVTNAIVTDLEVTPERASVPVGLTQQFTATATLSDGSTLDVTNDPALSWTSADTTDVTISSNQPSGNGLATGIAVGSGASIRAFGNANGTSFSDSSLLSVSHIYLLLTSVKDGAIADGIEKNEVEATVTTDNGVPVPGVEVHFTSNTQLALDVTVPTDNNGKALASFSSNGIPGTFAINTTLSNGENATTTSTFQSMALASAILKNNALADGVDTNIFEITLTLPGGGPAIGKVVNFSSSATEVVLSTPSAVTDANGKATVSLTSTITSAAAGYPNGYPIKGEATGGGIASYLGGIYFN